MSSNTGKIGVNSVRLGGMSFDELPIAESAITKPQIKLVEKAEKYNKIENVKAKYPNHDIDYLNSRIIECETNIVRIGKMKNEQHQMINEYSASVKMCEFRDDEISRINNDDSEKKSKIRDLEKRFPPYNIEAMNLQITQCLEAIDRGDEVIVKEHISINELKEVLLLCKQRDEELRKLGAL